MTRYRRPYHKLLMLVVGLVMLSGAVLVILGYMYPRTYGAITGVVSFAGAIYWFGFAVNRHELVSRTWISGIYLSLGLAIWLLSNVFTAPPEPAAFDTQGVIVWPVLERAIGQVVYGHLVLGLWYGTAVITGDTETVLGDTPLSIRSLNDDPKL